MHQSLSRALDILETVADRPRGMTFTEIVSALDAPKSSLQVLIQTLLARGYLLYNDDNARYTVGLRCFEVGSAFASINYQKEYIAQMLEEISHIINETVHFGILDRRDVVYLGKHECDQIVRMASSIGKRMPAHATALGKALLSGLSQSDVRSLYAGRELQRLQEATITDLDTLIAQLQEVRRLGYAWENCESSRDVRCVAAPLLDDRGRVAAAVSISFPVYRATENRLEMARNLLMEYASKMVIRGVGGVL